MKTLLNIAHVLGFFFLLFGFMDAGQWVAVAILLVGEVIYWQLVTLTKVLERKL